MHTGVWPQPLGIGGWGTQSANQPIERGQPEPLLGSSEAEPASVFGPIPAIAVRSYSILGSGRFGPASGIIDREGKGGTMGVAVVPNARVSPCVV